MSSTPIYDELLTEDGPPLVRIWHADTKGVIEIEVVPLLETQFAAAFALDLLPAGDKARIGLMAENESIGWWSRQHQSIEYVEPTMTAAAVVLAEEMGA